MSSAAKLTSGKKDKKGGDDGDKKGPSSPAAMDRYNKSYMSDVMETFRRMRGVAAVMMMNTGGLLGKSNFDKVTSGMYCGLANQILKKANPLIDKLSPTNKLRSIRSNGGGQELLISPVEHHDLIFVIVQNGSDRESIASNCLKPEEKPKRKRKTEAHLSLTELPINRKPSPKPSTTMSGN